jgi:hypothetical protein
MVGTYDAANQESVGSRCPAWSRTSGLRRMFRDLSRAVCIVCISRACALRTGCPHRARPGDPPSERTPAALHHAHRPASGVRPSAPGATAAPGSATLLATTRRAPASRRPAPGDTAAPPWRRHGHWGLQGAAMAGVNGRGAGQRGERSGTAPADRASRLRPGPGCARAAPPPRRAAGERGGVFPHRRWCAPRHRPARRAHAPVVSRPRRGA